MKRQEEFPNIDVEYLMSSYKSMKTHFGKLARLITGSGGQDQTERGEGILLRFSWLKTHFSRQRGKLKSSPLLWALPLPGSYPLERILMMIPTMLPRPFKKIELRPMCVIPRVVHLRCNLLLHLLHHLLPSPSSSRKSNHLIAS